MRIRVPNGTRSSCPSRSTSRPSPERTTVNSAVASKSAPERIRSSEQDHPPQCWESVPGVFDEIVVVDTASVDRTVEIAREFGARV
ncbi:MAG TPA: hypothetical protein VFF52_30465 [Isosphaeraceae bacterium]|nr:hypothetical protein [Isosphaeraceae bacterium]